MRFLFAAPEFADAELTQCARTLFVVAWSIIAIAGVILTAITIVQPELIARTATPVSVIALLGLIVLEMNRRGKTLAASAILVGCLALIVTITGLTAGRCSSAIKEAAPL